MDSSSECSNKVLYKGTASLWLPQFGIVTPERPGPDCHTLAQCAHMVWGRPPIHRIMKLKCEPVFWRLLRLTSGWPRRFAVKKVIVQ
jgi:hypothetical protein